MIVGLILLFVSMASYADTVTLDDPHDVNPPQAASLEWVVTEINASIQRLVVSYRWRDADGNFIKDPLVRRFICQNLDDIYPEYDNASCTGIGIPYECCTGSGTGTCDNASTCFSDVFGFTIRAQDVGTSIGVGLRTLLWNKFKANVLDPANDGTFD